MLLVPDISTVKKDPFNEGQLTVIADIRDPLTSESYSRDPKKCGKKS
jgi:glutamine synthetase